MSGLVKAKKYDWTDSNMALFGSDTEKQVKKESAESEPAWEGAGQEVGLKVWRIVKFKVTDWPKEDYGKFYDGDSYIILNTYIKEGEEDLEYDVHFWIGSGSTQDEYGTAAYKTVELDTLLDDKAVQHREVQKHETELFRSYFKSLTVMKGGADSGFRHVGPEAYKPRLFHFCGTRRNIEVREVPLCKSRLNSGDVFILDQGNKFYQWNGNESNKDERFKAMGFLQELISERGSAEKEILEESDTSDNHPFMQFLTDEDEDDEDVTDASGEKRLFKISDASGELTFDLVKEGDISLEDFQSGSEDVFIVDCPEQCFVWVGSGASPAEKQNSMSYAHNHLSKTERCLVPITVIKEGQTSADFFAAIGA